ncbi:MAG TPA: hypothetical protein EYM75_01170 [Dehalococcoidia bacterium]|nr:hypothetical protein [Dehalococcoidia bacterium]
MKCPHCQVKIETPSAQHACIDGVEVLIMTCPECETTLGIINHTHYGYFSRTQSMQDRTR